MHVTASRIIYVGPEPDPRLQEMRRRIMDAYFADYFSIPRSAPRGPIAFYGTAPPSSALPQRFRSQDEARGASVDDLIDDIDAVLEAHRGGQ